ncbi:hypothetical protein E2562_017906 [Oryza meyeriana var. granulata]|uniref:non-specific serine/threonine protein kinase n=1 Tax=Oryza meyeriana var. granulata TaxID=110450 RepID=A0A6G1CQY6_9ORYZ|nr:hypothetical protein E2562_017906 [Oryza meyeriana var. granulata]
MVLFDHSRPAIWSTNISKIASSSTVGVILDSGNLVLAAASNTSIVLWQSFDHFGNTWLPGGKLGRNKLAGMSTRLVAWKARNDPAPGVFSLELDPNGTSQYLLDWNSTRQYWTSGNWTGRIFNAKKLDDRSKPMIFVGYEPMSKAYRAYDPVARQVHVSRDIIFDEVAQWKWEDEQHAGADTDFVVEYTSVAQPGVVTSTHLEGRSGATSTPVRTSLAALSSPPIAPSPFTPVVAHNDKSPAIFVSPPPDAEESLDADADDAPLRRALDAGQ